MLNHFRNAALLEVPLCLKDLRLVDFTFHEKCETNQEIKQSFSAIDYEDILMLINKTATNQSKLIVGVVLSGGPAPGGHNVILGLYEALKEIDQHNQLIGFKDGFDGFLNSKKVDINQTILYQHRNVGGFYLTGSSRKKIQTTEDFNKAKEQALKYQLDALVVVGGDDSNTNAAILADFFIKEKVPCKVIGVPKTIDGDLKHKFLEISFGFDTASKIYSEEIGNILNDAKSAKKYYHFIKLMGRSASHLTLECAINTNPNYTFISEEMKKKPIDQQIEEIAQMIIDREKLGKNYGAILIPEGLLEFIPEFDLLIKEINQKKIENQELAQENLSEQSKEFFFILPPMVRQQIFQEKDPHGNIPLSQIQTELFIIEWVKNKLKQKEYNGKFVSSAHFIGYEGRSGFPTQFDCEYTYALGRLSAKMISSGLSGYMAGFKNLQAEAKDWQAYAIPLCSMMHFKDVKGEKKAVIEKSFVDFDSLSYLDFQKSRERIKTDDEYKCPGPIQFFGPKELVNLRPKILS